MAPAAVHLPIPHELTVTREAGSRQYVLKTSVLGKVVVVVTVLGAQMMIDFLNAAYPGEPVSWHIVPPKQPQLVFERGISSHVVHRAVRPFIPAL